MLIFLKFNKLNDIKWTGEVFNFTPFGEVSDFVVIKET